MTDCEKWIQLVRRELGDKYAALKMVAADPKEMVFETRTKMNCYYCGKYNMNWRCPPHLPDIDYRKMFSEYEFGMFVCVEMPFTQETFSEVRNNSSIVLHRALLEMEKIFYKNNRSMAISFIGGSCKLCKNGCGEKRCNNPYLSRSPLESTGINVVKSAAKYGIEITFPPKSFLMRVGMILW